MKKLSYSMIAAFTGVLIVFVAPAKAGDTDSCCNDGIAASPKVRVMLDERCRSRCVAPAQVTTTQTVTRRTDIAASPKVQQMLAERAAASTVQSTDTVGYRSMAADGIAASPKVRAMLDERRQTVEIAPLK